MDAHPYRRRSGHPVPTRVPRGDPDAVVIYALLLAVGAVRLTVAIALDEVFGAEATLAIVLVIAGLAGLVWGRGGGARRQS